ncbi:MAG: hypothetical protein C0402_09060 [Thermodesulfovibrio sp.]|nr:hypothetical protein [Thermodesulfovibrio sp.]
MVSGELNAMNEYRKYWTRRTLRMKRHWISALLLLASVLLYAGGVSAAPFTGLWVGTVAIDKVSESQIAGVDAFTTPQNSGTPFTFRLILHVNSAGTTVRLLKDVIQMEHVSTGAPVLITNDQRIPDFTCPDINGEKFCRRISTTAYDFDGSELAMTGSFSTNTTLNAKVVLTPDNPTNPFRHKFSPDHDNLDELGRPITDTTITETNITGKNIMEVYKVIRNMSFVFSPTDPLNSGNPAWGTSLMGGTFTENLKGLHKNTIYVSGVFRLSKVTDIGELTQ